MAYIFDGREFARKKEEILKKKVDSFRGKGSIPKLVSIIVGDDPASVLYVGLKKKAAERIGASVEIKKYASEVPVGQLIEYVEEINNDKNVHGIMVQLPLPGNYSKEDRDFLLASISPDKDVDGLRENSNFTPPTAKAVMDILSEGLKITGDLLNKTSFKIAVVGSSGFIGKQIVKALRGSDESYEVVGLDSSTHDLKAETKTSDVLISVTGVADLIKPEFVKENSVLIDVGSPKGDIDKAAYEKASFVSPVPGGVGPVTISSLMENLITGLEEAQQ